MPEGRHIKFAWDPLLSYFRDIYLIFTLCFYIVFVHYLWNFDLNLANTAAKKRYNTACLVITFNNHHYDITSIERYIGQSVAYA